MKKKNYRALAGLTIAAVCVTCIATGCQSMDDKLRDIQSQMTTTEAGRYTTTPDTENDSSSTEAIRRGDISERQTTEEDKTEEQVTDGQTTEVKSESEHVSDERVTDESMPEEDDDEYASADDFFRAKYVEIMNKYIELNISGITYEELNNLEFPYEVANNLYARYNAYIACGDLSNVGYAIEDLDGDGIKELILADMNSALIYEIYTLDGDMPKLVSASWDRANTKYCGDHFCTEGSNGAANFVISYETFRGGEMRSEYYLYTDLLGNGDKGLFYTTNSFMDKESDKLITQNEYDVIKDEAESGMCVYPGLELMAEP